MARVVLPSGRLGVVQVDQIGRRPPDDIVMVHGLGASIGFWYAGAVQWFRRCGRVTLFDLPGHGESDMPISGYTPAKLAAVLEELLDHLEIERAHIVAHSFGGSVALAFAARAPTRVKSLILADVRLWAAEPALSIEGKAVRVERLRDAGLSLADDRFDLSVQVLVELARLRLAQTDAEPAILDMMPGARSLFAGRRAAEKWLKLIETTDAYQEMTDPDGLPLVDIARIDQPVLAVYGGLSTCKRSALALEQACHGCQLTLIPDVGHFFPLTRPRLFAQIAVAFLRSFARAKRRRQRRREVASAEWVGPAAADSAPETADTARELPPEALLESPETIFRVAEVSGSAR